MKKLFSLTVTALFGFLVILLFCQVDCNDKTKNDPVSSNCGPFKTKAKYWDKDEPFYAEDHFQNIVEGKATYSYYLEAIEDICAYEHINGKFMIEFFTDTPTADVDISAEVMYGILYTYPIHELEWIFTETGAVIVKQAEFSFGMKFLYEGNPGYAFPILNISFNDMGSQEANTEFFYSRIRGILIRLNYYEWKDN